MERLVQSALQRILGFDRYLYWFSRVKIRSLRWDRNERDVLEFIRRIPEDGVALDLGANIGIMTALMAERVRRGHVHAYEPIPENFQALTRIVRRMKSRSVMQKSFGVPGFPKICTASNSPSFTRLKQLYQHRRLPKAA